MEPVLFLLYDDVLQLIKRYQIHPPAYTLTIVRFTVSVAHWRPSDYKTEYLLASVTCLCG